MSEHGCLIGGILGRGMVARLYRAGGAADVARAGGTPDGPVPASRDSVRDLMSAIDAANRQSCFRCGNAPGTHEIPGRSGVYCSNCWYVVYGERAVEQELAKKCPCAGCGAEQAVGRFHNQFDVPELKKWDNAWLCQECLTGITRRLARLLLKGFAEAPGKERGECACCGEELKQGFRVYLNWRRDRVPRELVSLVRWKGTILCGKCGRKLRTANAVLVPISDEDRKRGKKHPFWTGKFEIRPPTTPALDGVEMAPSVAAMQGAAETVATLVRAAA